MAQCSMKTLVELNEASNLQNLEFQDHHDQQLTKFTQHGASTLHWINNIVNMWISVNFLPDNVTRKVCQLQDKTRIVVTSPLAVI